MNLVSNKLVLFTLFLELRTQKLQLNTMKLTIKDKDPYQLMQIIAQQKYIQNYSYIGTKLCEIDKDKEKHTFCRPPNKQNKTLYDLIKIDSASKYSKVDPSVKLSYLEQTITKSLINFKLKYESWVGYLCIHCCSHLRQIKPCMEKIALFVDKFRAAFEENKCISAIKEQTLIRLEKYCQDSTLKPSYKTLQRICTKYQQTLLLEFLPVEYSGFIIDRYLSNDGDIQQYIRLCTSLTHFILNTCNPVNEAHFIDLMSRPYMGIVEWPIVIANLSMFQPQASSLPIIQPRI